MTEHQRRRPAQAPHPPRPVPLLKRQRVALKRVREIDKGRTWDDVVRAVNAQAAGQGGRVEGERMAWTKARLVRAVRALVRDGLAPAAVIAARGHQRTPAAHDRTAVLRAVAAIVGENPRVTLQEVADRLTALRLYPPQGGTRWSTSSVARIVQVAKREACLADRSAEPT